MCTRWFKAAIIQSRHNKEIRPMHKAMSMDNAKVKACIEFCRSCEQACASSVAYCLGMGGRHAASEHITLLLDCARICATAGDFMVRGSEHQAHVCGACAEVCEACGKACEQFTDDSTMRRCADACRQCAKACQEMAAMATK